MTEQPKPNLDKITPIGPGYVCIPSAATTGRSGASAPRMAVIAIAERADGMRQACVLNVEGRLEFAPGPVYPDGPSHDGAASCKALQEISQTLKTLLTLEQARTKKE